MKVLNSLVRVVRIKVVDIQTAVVQTCYHDGRGVHNRQLILVLNNWSNELTLMLNSGSKRSCWKRKKEDENLLAGKTLRKKGQNIYYH